MRYIAWVLILGLIVSFGPLYCAAESDENSKTLGDAVLGGLVGAGVGAAIGSASGHAGKGAAIGGGIGALGNIFLGKMKRSGQNEEEPRRKYSYDKGYYKPGVRRQIIREYDKDGNVVSEKEVYFEDEE